MTFQPANVQDLTAWLTGANARGDKVASVDLKALNRVLEHTPEDMTVTTEAGITLATLQAQLGLHGQWLPIDPPNPQNTTLSEILNLNLSGPRRFGCGTIRDHVIGLKVILADGRLIKSGGKVVKNVAGYDLQKLFIGSHGSLGVIVEVTFRLRPVPEAEKFVQARCESLEQTGNLIETVVEAELTPVVLDMHNLSTLDRPFKNVEPQRSRRREEADSGGDRNLQSASLPRRLPLEAAANAHLSTILGFAGTREEVDWQLDKARELGFSESATLDYEKDFWAEMTPVHRLSVLPSRTMEAIRGLGDVSFVARAGNGTIYHRGGAPPLRAELPVTLLRRVKETYDPKHILPDLPT